MRRPQSLVAALFVLVAVAIASCGSGMGPSRAPAPARPVQREVVGKSVEGRDIELWKMGNGPDVVLFIATIHGNENKGTGLMHDLVSHMIRNDSLLKGKTLLIVPVANPDGYARNVRTNSRGVDLNRNFPAANRENSARYGMTALCEPESRALFDVLHAYKPARIVSLHEPLDCIDWDGPAEPIARAMGTHCGLKVARVGARPGSLGSYAGETLRIPIITFELPEGARRWSGEERWTAYGRALVSAVTWPRPPK